MRKKWCILLGLIVVLLSFVHFFVNSVAVIALMEDKEKTTQQLFDNEYGEASIQYQIESGHIDW